MIKFKEDIQLEIVISFDEKNDTIAEQGNETFKAGQPVDAEIVNDDGGDYVDLQFADGTMALTVQRSSFDIIRTIKYRVEVGSIRTDCPASMLDDYIIDA